MCLGVARDVSPILWNVRTITETHFSHLSSLDANVYQGQIRIKYRNLCDRRSSGQAGNAPPCLTLASRSVEIAAMWSRISLSLRENSRNLTSNPLPRCVNSLPHTTFLHPAVTRSPWGPLIYDVRLLTLLPPVTVTLKQLSSTTLVCFWATQSRTS